MVLYLTPDQYEVFEAAIVTHGGKKSGRGLIEKEEALTKALTNKMK